MEDKARSKAWIYYITAIVSIIGGVLFAVLQYYEIRKARAEAVRAEGTQQAENQSNPTKPATPQTGQKPNGSTLTSSSKSNSTSLTLFPVKTEEDARRFWNVPRNAEDWQLVNGGLKLPGRVQRISSQVLVEGDCRVEFTCGSAGWKGPAVRLFGESIGLPPAIGGWPIQYHGSLVRKGTSLTLDVEVSQPGLKRLEDKQFNVTIKSANADRPSPISFTWPDDIGLTLTEVKVTGKTTIPEK